MPEKDHPFLTGVLKKDEHDKQQAEENHENS